MTAEASADNPYSSFDAQPAPVVSELDRRREELTRRLREARAELSPKAAVAAAANAGDRDEAAALTSSIAATREARSRSEHGFHPRSMTMKLIMERPDVTLRVLLAIGTLLFGARLASRFGNAAALIRTIKATLDSVAAPPQG